MVTLVRALQWRPRTPFYYGWLVIGMATLAGVVSTGTSQDVMGGIQDFITDETKWTRSTIALAVTIGSWSSALITPFIGRLADRYGARWLLPIGAIIAGSTFLALSEANSIWPFYLAYIPCRGVGNSVLMGVVPRTTAVNFFQRKRNIALALTSMARPIGVAAIIRLFSVVSVRDSWRAGYRYLGFLSLFLVVPLVVIMRRRPEDIGLLPDGAQRQGTIQTRAGEPERGPGTAERNRRVGPAGEDVEFSWTAGEAMRTRAFWLIAIASMLSPLCAAGVFFTLVPYLHEEVGISTVQAAGVLIIASLMGLTNLLWGYLADKLTPRWCLSGALVITAVAILYLLMVDSLSEAYLFGVLFGLFYGISGTLENMMLAQYYGRASFGSIAGMLAPLQTGALGLSPTVATLARDVSGSYNGVYIAAGALLFLAAILIFFVRRPPLPARLSAVSSASA